MLPLNFLNNDDIADYVCTGHRSKKACEEAKKFAEVNEINALDESGLTRIKSPSQWELKEHSKYIHYCDNETITGVVNDVSGLSDFKHKETPLFCDMTSSILTKSIQVENYSLIYASAQKNLGIAGLCVMVVKKDLLESFQATSNKIPSVYDYKKCSDHQSLVNTPPTFTIFVLELMLSWLKSEGGVDVLYKRMQPGAHELYSLIDASDIYTNRVSKEYRSLINIPFDVEDETLQAKFLQQAEKESLLGMRGHKSVGGVRISLYNAMSQRGIDKLIGFMRNFDTKYA